MVQITKMQNLFTFNVLGFHKIWSLKHKLQIQSSDIVLAYQNELELKKFKGIRFGTHIPYLITAGTFYREGKLNFWDVIKTKIQ